MDFSWKKACCNVYFNIRVPEKKFLESETEQPILSIISPSPSR